MLRMTRWWGFRSGWRYVDDFVLMYWDREYLISTIPKIHDFLQTKPLLTLHPDKITIRNIKDGFFFLGAIIKPYRTYIGNRTKENFYKSIERWNKSFRSRPVSLFSSSWAPPCVILSLSKDLLNKFLSSINSYLGITKQFSTYHLRKKVLLEKILANVWNYFYINWGYARIKKRRRIRQ